MKESTLNCLVQKTMLDLILFSHMRALVMNGFTQEKAYLDFLQNYNVSPEQITLDKARITYYRIMKDIINK